MAIGIHSTPWRMRCPRGHAGWSYRPEYGTYYCNTCNDGPLDVDPRFDELVDAKTGEFDD